MREGSGWTYQQIADHEGVEIGTIETLLWRARQALKREFAVVSESKEALAEFLVATGACSSGGSSEWRTVGQACNSRERPPVACATRMAGASRSPGQPSQPRSSRHALSGGPSAAADGSIGSALASPVLALSGPVPATAGGGTTPGGSGSTSDTSGPGGSTVASAATTSGCSGTARPVAGASAPLRGGLTGSSSGGGASGVKRRPAAGFRRTQRHRERCDRRAQQDGDRRHRRTERRGRRRHRRTERRGRRRHRRTERRGRCVTDTLGLGAVLGSGGSTGSSSTGSSSGSSGSGAPAADDDHDHQPGPGGRVVTKAAGLLLGGN